MNQQLSIGDLCTSDAVAFVHQRRKKKSEKETPEEIFSFQCRSRKLPAFMEAPNQCHFALKFNGRRWRFDFAFPQYMLAVEVEGLAVRRLPSGELVVMGRHASINGFREDCEKYNTAALLGWTVLRFEAHDVKPGHAIDMTMRVLASKGWKPEV